MDPAEESSVSTPLSCFQEFKSDLARHFETTSKELEEIEEEYQALKRFIQTEIDSCSEDQIQLLHEAENVHQKIAAFMKNIQCHLPSIETLPSRK
ncbi:hypothetical protein FDP41_002411 [Naegleria fowleri]|uniref:Uncharacterized protein n=1 Tax=Naegleria fowleri TaxID=5763 RepID=A0A6A5BVX5_NAEFO|nr:uncharacterized protein FDP41_002411 [Naegleria fowleri]KAF0978591.1 hypothetical protein FDP41_002411 [Naegleria fowleri]